MTSNSSTPLNGVNLNNVASCASRIEREPDTANSRWSAVVDWKGGFQSEARIREFEPIISDEPDSLGGTDQGPNPVEQVLAAFGNCLAIGYVANATAAGIKINNLRIDLDGNLDLHVFLGLKDGNAGFDNISVNVDIDSDATAEQLKALHLKVASTSPIGHSLSKVIPINIKSN